MNRAIKITGGSLEVSVEPAGEQPNGDINERALLVLTAETTGGELRVRLLLDSREAFNLHEAVSLSLVELATLAKETT